MKVWKVTNNDAKIIENLYEVRSGLPVKTLIKLTNLKQSTVYKRLNILLEQKLVEKISPIWKLVNGQSDFVENLLTNDNLFELHNLSYVVKLIDTPDWWNKRKSYFMRLKGWEFKNVDFGKNDSNPYQQLRNEKWVVQIYPESIIIMARKRYYGKDPYEVIIEGMDEFLDLWEWIEARMRFKFFKNGSPQVSIRSSHFNRIGDHLAEHCKKQGTKFLVELDRKRKVWVDYSEPFGKEANYPNGQELLEKHTKDILVKKPMLNSELQLMVQGLAENQMAQNKDIKEFANQLNKHIPAYEGMAKFTKLLFKEIKELRAEIKRLNK